MLSFCLWQQVTPRKVCSSRNMKRNSVSYYKKHGEHLSSRAIQVGPGSAHLRTCCGVWYGGEQNDRAIRLSLLPPGLFLCYTRLDTEEGGYTHESDCVSHIRNGSQKMGNLMCKPNRKDLIFMKELLEAGKVTPVIDRRFPLRDVADAIRYLEAGHAKGKVVITLEHNNKT